MTAAELGSDSLAPWDRFTSAVQPCAAASAVTGVAAVNQARKTLTGLAITYCFMATGRLRCRAIAVVSCTGCCCRCSRGCASVGAAFGFAGSQGGLGGLGSRAARLTACCLELLSPNSSV